MKTNEEIISHVNDLMNLNNINASELSRRVKVSKSTMSRYLNGSREFPINKAHDFARALNTTTADLIGLETKTINEVTITELPYYGAVAAGNFEQGVSAGGKIEIPSSIIKESKENYFVLKANGTDYFVIYTGKFELEKVSVAGLEYAGKEVKKDEDYKVFVNSFKEFADDLVHDLKNDYGFEEVPKYPILEEHASTLLKAGRINDARNLLTDEILDFNHIN